LPVRIRGEKREKRGTGLHPNFLRKPHQAINRRRKGKPINRLQGRRKRKEGKAALFPYPPFNSITGIAWRWSERGKW